ncbi:MAG TPA: hypothetical protein VGI45_22665 [Terracidiphilus sp.]|jgi:hypothetical protein
MVAVNDALLAPDAIATFAGTFTAPLLLAIATLTPLEGAAEVNDTVQAVDPAPVNVLAPHESVLIKGVAFWMVCAINDIETDFATLPWLAVMVAV